MKQLSILSKMYLVSLAVFPAYLHSMEPPEKHKLPTQQEGKRKKTKRTKEVGKSHLLFQLSKSLPANEHALFTAIAHDDIDKVNEALDKGAKLNATDNLRRTPLHWAAALGHNTILTRLIAAGASINAQDRYGATPLHDAVDQGNLTTVRALLQTQGIIVDTPDDSQRTPLHNAALQGNAQILHELLEHNANPNATDEEGITPLHEVALNGALALAQDLLDHRAAVDPRDNEGHTPLHNAARSGNTDIAAELLDRGADVNARDSHAQTPLFIAVVQGHLPVIEELLRQWADVNIYDETETPLLLQAARYKDKDIALLIMEMLLTKNPNVPASLIDALNGMTARPEIVALIIDYAARWGVRIPEPEWLTQWRLARQSRLPVWMAHYRFPFGSYEVQK